MEPSGENGERRHFEDFRPELRGDGHALCGPVEVRGAEPGMTLELRVVDVRTGTWGRTVAGRPHQEELNQRLGVADRQEELIWTRDPDALVGRDQYGHTVALRPFMGVMGMPPDEPPRTTGGNIDCKELMLGSSLFLPIAVPGSLFSVGDGHAIQGDGEVCQSAIECPVELLFGLDRHLALASVAVDFRVSQVVNGAKGVHAVLPRGSIR